MGAASNSDRCRRTGATALLLSIGLSAGPASAEVMADWLGVDGFEYPPADALRVSELALRDPHVFLETPLGCLDFTDTPIPFTQISFNAQLAEALNGDSNPADGFLDASSLLLFHPASQRDGDLQRLDLVAGDCTAPVNGTVCSNAMGATPLVDTYLSSAAGACLEALPGTSSGYSPGLPAMAAPCWLNRPRDSDFAAQGLTLPLLDAQQGGQWVGDGVDNGLQRGFLSEAAAEQIQIPNPLGGQPIVLASLLPGGAGSCASGDDRDMHRGISGWWMYLQYSATPVPYAAP